MKQPLIEFRSEIFRILCTGIYSVIGSQCVQVLTEFDRNNDRNH